MSKVLVPKGSNFICRNCNAVLLEAEADIVKLAPQYEPPRTIRMLAATVKNGIVLCKACGKKAHYIHDSKNWHLKIGG